MKTSKSALMAATLFAAASVSQATVVGPDAFGYTARANSDPGGVAYSFVDISVTGTQIIGNWVDEGMAAVALGSPFQFYGVSYTSMNVSTNGFIRFDGSTTNAYANTALPASSIGAAMMVYWDDLATRTQELGDGGVWYQYFNDSPHAGLSGPVSIVMWRANHYDNHLGVGQFEALFEHSTNRILFQYSNLWMGLGLKFGASSTVGIQQGGPDGTALEYQRNTIYSIPDRSTILFDTQAVPEPAAPLALGGGLLALGLAGRRRWRR